MTMNDIFGDGEVLGALVVCLTIGIPLLIILAYDTYKEYKRRKVLRLCGKISELCQKIRDR